MVFDLILGAILVAFGVISIFFAIETGLSDPKLMAIMILGALLIFAGGWIFISKLTVGFILRKVAGIVLAGLGAFLVLGFPDIKDYQKVGMGKAGIFAGLAIGILGLWLLLT
jgi:hypothetical protein